MIVFTNTSDVTSVAKNFESKYSQITNAELLIIEPSILQNILRLALGQQPKELEKYIPREHQKIAITNVVKHLKANERGQLILPCGAGKTLTALWIKEKLKFNTTLVLLPSLALLKQIKNDWARHKNYPYSYMCVCSEKDIDKDQTDSVTVHTYEIGGPVSTDSEVVRGFIEGVGEKVIFSTYQSLNVIRDACKSFHEFTFDVTICDEAHRTAGSKNKNVFTLVHDNKQIPSKKRLYMTATPKVVSTKLKTRLGEDYELLCDMSNTDVFGEEAFRMSFGEAIEKGILVDYKIIGIGVTDKDVKKFIEERNYIGNISIDELAHNFALNMVMHKYRAFHGLSFHSRVIYAKDFANRHKNFFEEIYSKHVEGKQSTTYRTKVLHEFKNSRKGVVSNARCLTEGVDVPTIDLIYFCDPKTSKIDIVQASGRALRTDSASTKKMGYIVVPIFHHIKENLEAEIKRKPIFHHLIQVVRSLCDQDERLQAEINEIAFKKGERTNSKIKLDFSDGETERIIRFEGLEKRLRNVLFDEIIEKTKIFWDVMFKKLEKFVKLNGHIIVSKKENKQLSNWIYEQRRQNRAGRLSELKKNKLISIGFDWKSEDFRTKTDLDDIWWESYSKLVDYYEENGNTEVPARYSKDKPLGTWVVSQGKKRRDNNLSQGRIELLNELKFNWNRYASVFDQFCERLIEFKAKYGHTEVPIISKDFPKFGKWTNKYRSILNNGVVQEDGSIKYAGTSLQKEQIDKLFELGFKKSVRKMNWEDSFLELKKYYLEHGNCRPTQSEYPHLYYWCYKVRKQQSQLTKGQRKLLDEIKFDFLFEYKYSHAGSNEHWIERFAELQLFYEENKHLNITPENEEFEGLYKWFIYQSRQLNNNKLTQDKVIKLKSIGYEFNTQFLVRNTTGWETRFEELSKYYKKNGTFYISSNAIENKSLLSWLSYQRSLLKKGNLDINRKNKLLSLGYSFNKKYLKGKDIINPNQDNAWDEKLVQLEEYHSEHKTFLIPKSKEKYKQLKSWLQYQRNLHRQGVLKERKVSKLSSIGFSFDTNYRGKKIENNTQPKVIHNKIIKNEKWNKNLEKLKDFHLKFNTFLIPNNLPEYKYLKAWIQEQKRLNKIGKLSNDKLNRLYDVGYSFDLDFRGKKFEYETNPSLKKKKLRSTKPKTDSWEKNYLKLLEYKIQNNNCSVPRSYKDKSLSNFVTRQRFSYRKKKLLNSQIQKLELLGFEWEVIRSSNSGPWHTKFLLLKDFFNKTGHSLYRKSDGDLSLYHWVLLQRMDKKKGKLHIDRVKALDSISFVWNTSSVPLKSRADDDNWLNILEKLDSFKKEKGHCLVPQIFSENRLLGRWVNDQRNNRNKGRLSQLRIDLLNDLGFIWDTKAYEWDQKLELLKRFHIENGHFNVKQKDKGYQGLYYWIYKIKKDGTSIKRIEKLRNIKYNTEKIKIIDNK